MLGLITPPPALVAAPGRQRSLVATPGRACSPRMMANWDPVRFATTAAFFNAPPSPGELLKRVLTPAPALSDAQLWSAERPELLEWGPLDDVVMGGVSRSTFITSSSCATFSGVMSHVICYVSQYFFICLFVYFDKVVTLIIKRKLSLLHCSLHLIIHTNSPTENFTQSIYM